MLRKTGRICRWRVFFVAQLFSAVVVDAQSPTAGAPDLPAETTIALNVEGDDAQCSQPPAPPCGPTTVGLVAGADVNSLALVVTDSTFFPATGLASARIMIVRATLDQATLTANRSICQPGNNYSLGQTWIYSASGTWLNDRVVPPYGAPTVLSTSDPTGTGFLTMSLNSAEVPIQFRMGGSFRICYSQDGAFGDGVTSSLLPLDMNVWGVYDHRPECEADFTCLRLRAHRCYLLKEAYNNPSNTRAARSSCTIDYTYSGAGYKGTVGGNYPRVSWSTEFEAVYTEGGAQIGSTAPAECGTIPAAFLCPGSATCTPGDYFAPTMAAGSEGLSMNFPAATDALANDTSPRFEPRTIAACFCAYGGCAQNSDFKQQVGLLMYYTAKVCYNGVAGEECAYDFTGVTPQQRFSLRVECPPDGCIGASHSRIKIVPQSAANDQPSWKTSTASSTTGCGAAQHGINAQGKVVLPAGDNVQVDIVNGRSRKDFKIWNYKSYLPSGLLNVSEGLESGFMFDMGFSDYEKRNIGGVQAVGGESFDVCFCDDACDKMGNWFKVGQLRFVPFQLISGINPPPNSTASGQELFAIEYANQPGMFGFYRTQVDAGAMGMTEGGMLKLVSDPHLNVSDAGCKDDPAFAYDPKYDRDLVFPGPIIDFFYKTAYNEYQGVKADGEDALLFNNGSLSNTITVKKAGFLAVCYCSGHIDGECINNQWVLTSRITIRGPMPNHEWHFSTHVVFRLEYEGWGLTSNDQIRIIPPTSECMDPATMLYGPRAAYPVTYMKLKCPYPCTEVGEVTSSVNGGIETKVLGDSTWMCNDQNEDCRVNDIKSVTVLDAFRTEIEFEKAHGMSNGDLITITDNIVCHAGDAPDECNDARLAVLKGLYPYADATLGTQPVGAPKTYFSGHIVTVHPTDPMKVHIPVGWPSAPSRPRFVIAPGATRRGRWVRHSKAITKLEIKGERATQNMKVCWAYPTTTEYPMYTTQVGTLTLEDPNTMQNCLITPTTLRTNQRAPWAPFIFSFQTAGSETGKKYGKVQGPSWLRIYLTSYTSAIYATFGDGSAIDKNTGEDDMAEARQYICGKIFKELWSSDPDLGFPMPSGCYYTVYGTTQEINVLFDPKNGLKAGEDYQMVMTGVFMDEAQSNKEYAQIFTMDDYFVNPYTAIERGRVLLAQGPLPPAYGTDGVEFFRPDGVKVVSRTGPDMMELTGSNTISLKLRGESSGGGIKASSILRMFLQPLTQWDVAQDCMVTCTPHDDITHPCGAVQDCKGDSLIANFQKNYLRIVLPASMSTMTADVNHELTISGLVFPKGGFFPTKFGVELRRADDTKPDYVETVGNFFYKEPDDGASVGKVVEFYGDGDQRPFAGDQGNVLYAQVMLASTLFASQQSGDAVMRIVLPEGYECTSPATADGSNPWQAPPSLGVFGDLIPQGTGAPFESDSWSGNGNVCQYSLRQNGVVYAGSSLVIRVTANNPATPLKRTDPRNRWSVELTAKGYYTFHMTFPPVTFGADAEKGNFSLNKPVLGRITETKMVPSVFSRSLDVFNIQMTWVRIFMRAQQDSGVDAQVRIMPAAGFSFPNPCIVRDIPITPFNYYAPYSPGLRKPTMRLPGITGCKHVRWPGEMADSHIAGHMTGSILAHTYYAFETHVQMSFTYDRTERNTWQIFTTDGYGNRVDGTPRTSGLWPDSVFDSAIGMAAINSTNPTLMEEEPAFGIYERRLDPTLKMSSMLPSSVNGLASIEVGFVIPDSMAGTGSTLRVTAPEGFVWRTDSYWVAENLGGARPGDEEDNVIAWPIRGWSPRIVCKFISHIEVPDFSPQTSVNELLIEFGHRGKTLSERLAAGRAAFGPVEVMSNAVVDYTQNTNLQDPPNEISLQFMTVNPVEAGGGIHITGPANFQIARDGDKCMPGVAPLQRGSPYNVLSDSCCADGLLCAQRCPEPMNLPADVQCKLNSAPLEPVSMDLVAGASGLQPGLYRFMLQAVNPGVPLANPVNDTIQCGRTRCWTFTTYKNFSEPTPSVLNTVMYTPAFDIRTRLVEAGLSELTDLQAAETGRDDRPLLENSLVLFFKLTKQILTPETLIIRAPQGFIFKEDCLESMEVREREVYGNNQDLAPGDTAWPSDVVVKSCRGEGPNAVIHTDPGIGQGFLAEMRYPFRIKVFNPRTQPATKDNRWVIGYADESSRPFNGFSLWTFKRVTSPPLPASIGASLGDSSIAKLWNPVTFTLAPHNTIRGRGMVIRVVAPPLWQIANEALKSRIMVQPVSEAPGEGSGETPPDPNWDARPSLIWGDEEIDAAVDEESRRVLTATLLSDTRELTAGRDYQITIYVYNPVVMVDQTRENEWTIETFNSPSDSPVLPLFRDRIIVSGYSVMDTLRAWMLRNEDPATGYKFYNGLQRVEQLYFEMQFPSKLDTTKPNTVGDEIVLHTPAGYKWVDCPGTFRWEPPKDYELYLPNSPRVCTNGAGPLDRSNMTIRIREPLAVPAMRKIMFRVDVRNPAKTPHVMLNHWMATHYSGTSGAILSTSAFASWEIIPQLANVSIDLVGTDQNKAAGSQSRISVSFTPVSDADQVYLRARVPLGFDFTGCSALSNGHEIIDTDLDKVRVRAAIYAGVRANIVVDNFKLGQIGGPTEFDVITRLNNGEQMDESLLFTGGFELSGYLRVWNQSVMSDYQLNPTLYPGQRQVRMNARATVKFIFTLTRQAEPNDLIAISSDFYKMYQENFMIRRLPAGVVIGSEVVSFIDGAIVAQIMGTAILATVPGFTDPSYEVSVEVQTPNLQNAMDTRFLIEVRKPGDETQQMPLNTNDGRTPGFRLVENVLLRIQRLPSNEAPPMAEVDVEIVLDPKSAVPQEFLLMAPPMFNFTDDCLVRGGESNEIESCTRIEDEPMSGRAQALLRASGAGLAAPSDFVVIRINTPAMDASDARNRMWFVDARQNGLQVGWGEDPKGMSIRQMAGAAVVFSGIPQISTQLSVTFFTGEKVEAGGKIRVFYPRSIVVMCDGEFLEKVALEGDITCNNQPRQGLFDLVMARPMPPGQQAFTVTATPPDAIDDVEGNIFRILVYTPDSKVVDAAMNVSGNRVQHGITVKALELTWTASLPGRPSVVSFGFELLVPLPAKDPPVVSEIVVTVPQTMEQTVTRASHIEILGLPFPFREGTWLNVQDPRKVKLLLDEQKVETLEVGKYRVAFPILLPTRMPKYNVYHVSLCERNPRQGDNTTCSGDPQDPRVITTFPLAGFALGQEHPSAMLYRAAGGSPRRCPALLSVALLVAHAVLSPLLSRALWP